MLLTQAELRTPGTRPSYTAFCDKVGGERRHPFCPIEPTNASLAQLADRLGARWTQLVAVSARTLQKKNELSQALAGLDSADTSIVAFGSLARNEFTQGSDIDWTLLIDGQAASEHLATANKVRDEIAKLEGKEPGGEGIFGKLSFSHEIIHEIGGQNDTNANTTQRILLLLESCVLGKPEAHDRVIGNILGRYLSEDRGLWYEDSWPDGNDPFTGVVSC